MSTNIKIKSSAVSGNVPSNLLPGELALGRADGKLFYLDAANTIDYFENSNSFSTVIANGTSLFATSPSSILAIGPDSSNSIVFTANTQSDTISIGINQTLSDSFVRKVGDTMTGDLHVDTANVYANNVSANTLSVQGKISTSLIGDLGGYVQAAFDKANTDFTIETASFDHANAAYDQANTATLNAASASAYANTGINNAASASLYANTGITLAQAAYDYANSAVMEVAVVDEPYTANGSSNTFFINFTDRTNATVNSVFTNVDVLTYVPQTGTLSSNVVAANTSTIANISSISAGTVTLTNMFPAIVDRLDVSAFRSASYHFQMENGLDSHMINMNVLNGDTLATFTFYGETFTYDSLGAFSANVSSGMVNVIFTPEYAPMTVSYMRRSLDRLGIVYPPVDLGTVFNASTNTLDLGYISMSADHIVDYGDLAYHANNTPYFGYQNISGTIDTGTF